MSDLLTRIQDIRRSIRPSPSFTLEPGRGETYRHSKPVLYSHSEYPETSVLAGQPQRIWVASWETWDEAREALSMVRKGDPSFTCDDYGEGGGSSYISTDVMTRHLPDNDY